MKVRRHNLIIDLIEKNEVSSQEVLQQLLKENGVDVTQATVSRDIKVLDLVKTMKEDGRYRYTRHEDYARKRNAAKYKSVFVEATIKVDFAMNIVVIKCHVGMANAACAALETMSLGEAVGTIAGDDTIFILLKNEQQAKEYVRKIGEMLY